MSTISTNNIRKRILTGDRPTGRLHLGHLVGSLENRVKLQYQYDTIIIIADLHMLTTKRTKKDIEEIGNNARGLILDYLAAGIDPEVTTIYLQSAIPEIYELNTLFQNLVSANRLSRVPSIKDMARAANIDENSIPYGLLGYPVLQAADILLPKANLVPIGKDNLAHVEVCREIANRFNQDYGYVFPVPEPLLGEIPTLPGIDGKGKMSKSAGNAILLSDDKDTIRKKIRSMYTDPNRTHAHIPGNIEGNPVFIYHEIFNKDKSEVQNLKLRYQAGLVGDVEVKDKLTKAVNKYLEPIRKRMDYYENQPILVDEILLNGIDKMRAIAIETIREVRKAMGLDRVVVQSKRRIERQEKKIAIK